MPELSNPFSKQGIAPTKKELITLETADQPKKKGERVAFGGEMLRAVNLLSAKTELDRQITDLQELIELGADPQTRTEIEQDIRALETNRAEVLSALAELRPEEYADEAAMERALQKPTQEFEQERERALQLKNDLEERVGALKGDLRLRSAELEEARLKNPAMAAELEHESTELQTELLKLEGDRIKAWEALALLDSKRFGADAELERSLYEQEKSQRDAFARAESSKTIEEIQERISRLGE
jgi:hypothetical protein